MDEAQVASQQFAAAMVWVGCAVGAVASIVGITGTVTRQEWAEFPHGPVAHWALGGVGLALVGTLLFCLS